MAHPQQKHSRSSHFDRKPRRVMNPFEGREHEIEDSPEQPPSLRDCLEAAGTVRLEIDEADTRMLIDELVTPSPVSTKVRTFWRSLSKHKT